MARKRVTPFTKSNLIKALKKGADILDLSEKFQKLPSTILKEIDELRKRYYNIKFESKDPDQLGIFKIQPQELPKGNLNIDIDMNKLNADVIEFGVISDLHLNSKFERIDLANAIYDVFADNGIKTVYDQGNWIDGYAKRINHGQVYQYTVDGQLDYAVANYPQRKGIDTHFIGGDDHEGWFQKDTGLDVGRLFQQKAEDKGRTDLHYLGYMEADIYYETPLGAFHLRTLHGGGGSTYALSYYVQKLIESIEPAEKPHMMLVGHLHKALFIPKYDGVAAILSGCVQDQSNFMRKKKLKAMQGAWMVKVILKENGEPWQITPTFIDMTDLGLKPRRKYYIPDEVIKKRRF